MKRMIMSVLLIMLLVVTGVCGCGKKAEEEQNDYPKIAYIDDITYYGTDEVCTMVPRKAPDGTIETFVSPEIMPDAHNSANFGSGQGKLEYMHLEDGQLIIHIGEDWYYFESQQEAVMEIGNPWTDSDEEGVLAATGSDMKAPEGAEGVYYSFMEESKMAQMTYTLDNISWVYRSMPTEALEDISGMNYEWVSTDEGTVSGREAVYMAYSDAEENAEYIDDVNYVQVVIWYDDAAGTSYSLSACGTDLNGMDIQVYAEQLFN